MLGGASNGTTYNLYGAGRKSPCFPHRACGKSAPGWPHNQSTSEEDPGFNKFQEVSEEQDLLQSMACTVLSYLSCKMQVLYLELLPGDCCTAQVMTGFYRKGN